MKLFSSFTQKDTKRDNRLSFFEGSDNRWCTTFVIGNQEPFQHSQSIPYYQSLSISDLLVSLFFSLLVSLSLFFSPCLSELNHHRSPISHIPQKLGIRSKTQSFLMGISLIHLIYTTNLSHNYCLFYVFPSCLYRIELNFNLVFFFF